MNVPIELVGKDGRPIPPEESPMDEHTPPATNATKNPFEGMTVEEVFERLRWDGTLGPKPIKPNGAALAKAAKRRKAKQKAAKAARKRNRR